MPFISKDWRSPGEAWVKTAEGWEKKKVLENCRLRNENAENEEPNKDRAKNEETAIQPHCRVTIRCTKEIAGFNELDEVVKRLDFKSAVRDVRRFRYVCAILLELLAEARMRGLGGCAQRALLATLEEAARHAAATQHDPRHLRHMTGRLEALARAASEACWGDPIGSQLLWHQHTAKIERILSVAAQMEIVEPGPDARPALLQLPEECLREVLLRLSDHRDLVSGSDACVQMAAIVGEQRIWRELTKFHFTQPQIELVSPKGSETTDWKGVFHSLKKTFGISEERQYAETLSLCRYCRCLFWKSLGHPCGVERGLLGPPAPASPVPPSAFLKLFSL